MEKFILWFIIIGLVVVNIITILDARDTVDKQAKDIKMLRQVNTQLYRENDSLKIELRMRNGK